MTISVVRFSSRYNALPCGLGLQGYIIKRAHSDDVRVHVGCQLSICDDSFMQLSHEMRSGDMSKGKVLPRKGKLIHTFPRSTHFSSSGLELHSKGLVEGP